MLILAGHTEPVRSVSYAPDSCFLASGSEDKIAYIWDLATGKVIDRYEHPAGVERLSFNPHSGLLTCGTAAGDLLIWDHKVPSNLHLCHGSAVRSLAHSPDGRLLASLCWQGRVRFWQADSLQDHGIVPLSGVVGTALAFLDTIDQTIALACQDGKVRFIDRRGREPFNLVPNRSLLSLAVHGDRWLAAGSTDGAILLWDLPSRSLCPPLEGHTGPVYGLAFTPDGKTLVSGGADGTVRLWDVEMGRPRECYRWHKSWVTCVAVSPDGMTAAAGSEDATVVVWDLDPV